MDFSARPRGSMERKLSPPPLTEGTACQRCICQPHCAGPGINTRFLPRSYTTRTNIVKLQPKGISSFLPKQMTLNHDKQEKLLFWHQTLLSSCSQVGKDREPVIFVLHREFSFFYGSNPHLILTKLFISIIPITDTKFYKLITTSVGALIVIHILTLLLYKPKF